VCDKLAAIDPQNLSWVAARALTLAHCSRHGESAAQVESLLGRAKEGPGARLQAARCFAVCSQHEDHAAQKRQFVDQALAAIAAAATADFNDPVLLSTDPDLAALQPELAFQAVLKGLTERK
jgi:hypothetical protein